MNSWSMEQAIAEWMLGEFEKDGELFQVDAVSGIERLFGTEYVGTGNGGSQAISPKVLAEFRRLTEGTVVWSRSERCWRRKSPIDVGRLTD